MTEVLYQAWGYGSMMEHLKEAMGSIPSTGKKVKNHIVLHFVRY
jgi:hypothetical protein